MRTSRLCRCLTLTAVVGSLALSQVAVADAARPSARSTDSLRAMGSKAHPMQGGNFYKHTPPLAGDHDQFEQLKLPRGTFRPRSKSRVMNIRGPQALGAGRVGTIEPVPDVALSVPFNTAHAASTNNDPVDPNEASAGSKVVYVTNEFVALSVDSGATFHSFDPASFYPDSPDGGVCCDQIVQYVPSIDRFVWLDQYWGDKGGVGGKNRYRLAVFAPSAVTAAGLTSWIYWDITAAMLPALSKPFLDFPDLAFGDSYLYLSANNGQNGSVSASVIARIGLDNLALGLNLAAGAHAWRYIAGPLFMGRVAQNTGSRAFWARTVSTSSIGVSYWDESSNSWFGPAGIGIFTWPNSGFGSTTPDGKSWLFTYTGQVLAATRAGQNDLWLAWTAGRGSGQLAWLNQPHVEMVDVNTSSLTFKSQRVIWNPGYAFAYPNLNTNALGEVGVSLAWGGNGHWVNLAVGDLTLSPFLVWDMTASNANCGCNRWGDYTAVRPANTVGRGRGSFSAAGYGTNTNPTGGGGTVYDPHYVNFSVSP